MRLFCLTLLSGALIPNAVEAAVINYSEAVSGDLPGQFLFLSDLPVFDFGIGENKFSGEVTLTSQTVTNEELNDFDSFAFNLPSDTSLTSILINTSLLPGSTEGLVAIGYELIDSSGSTISPQPAFPSEPSEGFVRIPTSNTSLFDSTLPVISGKYFFRNSYFASAPEIDGSNYSITAAYNISFNVEAKPVPEPSSTIGLLAIGSLGAYSVFNRKLNKKVK